MSKLIIPFFLSFAVALIFGAHYFVYRSVWFFFKPLPASRPYVAALFVLAGISFPLSMVMVHYWENRVVRGYYYLSGAGLGLMLYLILGFAAAWLAYFILVRFQVDLPLAWLGSSALAVAFVITVAGLWNAYNPKVTHITIPIRNLPDVWQGKTVVQLSDVHLGAIYGLHYIDRLVRQVNGLQPELILITGDLFDGMDGRLDDLGSALAKLKSNKGTFFITGNHETYLGVDKSLAAMQNGPIEHLGDRAVSIEGLAIVGIDYPVTRQRDTLIQRLQPLEFNRPAILLYHEPVNVPEVAGTERVDVMLSGHTHRGQLWPFDYIVKAIYGPYAFGLNKIKDFHSYTSVGTGTWGPPMRTEGWSEITAITLTKAED
jgi:predicted MPP superfamily phosphohydrolase